MSIFNNKKFIVLIILVILIIIIAVFFFYKNSNSELTFDSNMLYFNNSNLDTTEDVKIAIHIIGEVKEPGMIYLPQHSRITDAIEKAGGITEYADLNKINLAYELRDGQKIYIPSIYDEEDISYISDSAGSNVLETSVQSNTININTANETELKSLPGIGDSTAKKIIEYREKEGRFQSIEDIKNVSRYR